MPRQSDGTYNRTNGVFTGRTTWNQQANSGDDTIRSNRHDTHDNDLGDALTDSLSRSGNGAMQADLNVSTFKITGSGFQNSEITPTNRNQARSLAVQAAIAQGVVDVTDPQFGADKTGASDSTAAINAAIAYAFDNPTIIGTALYFPAGSYVCQEVRLTVRSTEDARRNLPWHVFGYGAELVNPATATTDKPCLYSTHLAEPGSSEKTFAGTYASGVNIYGLRFRGANNFGVGYKHAVSGNLLMADCLAEDLEDGFKMMGVATQWFSNCWGQDCSNAGFRWALLADDSYTVNYTAEGTGWNDGVNVQGGGFRRCLRGYDWGGSTSEGILKFIGVQLTPGNNTCLSGIRIVAPFQSVSIENCWSEFFDNENADIIKFQPQSGSNFEGNGPVVISNNHFFNNNGRLNYAVNAKNSMLTVEDNTFQLRSSVIGGIIELAGSGGTDGSYDLIVSGGNGSGCEGNFTVSGGSVTAVNITNGGSNYGNRPNFDLSNAPGLTGAYIRADLGFKGCVYNESGTRRQVLPTAKQVVPSVTSNMPSGEIRFNGIDLADIGGRYTMYYMTNGSNGDLLLRYRSGLNVLIYDIFEFKKVWSPTFPTVGPNWQNTQKVNERVKQIGIQVDFDTLKTGLTYDSTAGYVELTPAIDGGSSATTNAPSVEEAITHVRRNTYNGVDSDLWYVQREFGEVIMYDNSNYIE